jgi:nicotinic acid mononucleotide adenylyltransferase
VDAVRARLARPDRVELFEIEPHDISSSELRELAARGEPLVELVPAAVALRIAQLGLYRAA